MMSIYKKYLKEIVENYFLCPSTIENMWIYKSDSESFESKNNYNYRWHYDGDPDKTLKIIFYIKIGEKKGRKRIILFFLMRGLNIDGLYIQYL